MNTNSNLNSNKWKISCTFAIITETDLLICNCMLYRYIVFACSSALFFFFLYFGYLVKKLCVPPFSCNINKNGIFGFWRFSFLRLNQSTSSSACKPINFFWFFAKILLHFFMSKEKKPFYTVIFSSPVFIVYFANILNDCHPLHLVFVVSDINCTFVSC